MLFLGLLLAALSFPAADAIGVCYGQLGNNLPSPQEVVALYKQQNIQKMRIYDPNPSILQALRGSNIELMLGVATETLESLASDPSAATRWVQTNVQNYISDVKIKYIVVSNEVSPNVNSRYVPSVLPALNNVYNAIVSAGLQNQVQVTLAFDTTVTENTFPPSDGVFTAKVRSFVEPIVGFLVRNRAPILVNVYPYFAYAGNPSEISLSYSLFTNTEVQFTDPNNDLDYQNLFDAILDGFYAALGKAGGSSLDIVVAETGWPSSGGGAATTVANASTYHRNLVKHVKEGSPLRPGKLIETYMFAMFDENQKGPEEQEKYFGLFLPNKQSKYGVNFS